MNTPRLARRMQQIAPFRVMEILAQAKQLEAQGRDLVHMEVGEPDFPAPPQVIEAAQAALARGKTHYTAACGLPRLREALAGYYADRFGVEVDPRRIILTPGASGALQLVLGVLVDPGERVLLQDPGYPCNRHMVQMFGGQAVALPPMAHGFDAAAVTRALSGARGLMLATPANPTGEVIPLDQLGQVHGALDTSRQFLLVDEIYQGLQYDGVPQTALSLGEPGLFVINSFSKFFGMTGFRLGWLVAPEEYVESLQRLAQNLFLAPSTIAQHAAMAVFSEQTLQELERRRQVFARRREVLFEGLRSLGFALPEQMPQGAFYVYAGLNGMAASGVEFCRQMLEQAGVAITPGLDFGQQDTARSLRFAYTTDESRIAVGLARMREFLGR